MSGGNQLVCFVQNMIGQYCHRCRTVARDVIHLVGGLFNQLSTNLKTKRFIIDISDVNTLRHRYTVVRHTWTTITFPDHNVASFRTHRGLDCVI